MNDRGLRLIALFKFAKALLLIAVGLGALQLLHPDTAARAQRWATALATSSDRRIVQHLLAQAMGMVPGRLVVLALSVPVRRAVRHGRLGPVRLRGRISAVWQRRRRGFEILQRLDLLRVDWDESRCG